MLWGELLKRRPRYSGWGPWLGLSLYSISWPAGGVWVRSTVHQWHQQQRGDQAQDQYSWAEISSWILVENHECFLELWDLSLHEMDNTQPARAAGQVIDSKLAIPCIGNFLLPSWNKCLQMFTETWTWNVSRLKWSWHSCLCLLARPERASVCLVLTTSNFSHQWLVWSAGTKMQTFFIPFVQSRRLSFDLNKIR